MKCLSLIFIFLTISSLEALTTYQSQISSMSLDQKIAQLMIVAACCDHEKNQEFIKKSPYNFDPNYVEHCVQNCGVGGVVFLGASNLNDLRAMVKKLQGLRTIPLFTCLDAEWGLGMRMPKDVIPYPHAMTLGALSEHNDTLIYELGRRVGYECKSIGINWNFAPVADVNNNSKNPIINTRSFGENPKKVASKAWLFAHGLQDAGIMTCAKHFPGHGDTSSDSHHSLPVITHDMGRLNSIKLVPFKYVIEKGIPSIMTAHMALPRISEHDRLPATLSHTIITELLKKKMGFKGLVVTDGLGMRGITDQYAPGETELKALQAGCNIVLCPVDVEKAIGHIRSAVESGELSESTIDEKVAKVLHAKESFLPPSYEEDTRQLISQEGLELKQKIYESALTLVKRDQLPLNVCEPLCVITCGTSEKPLFIRELEKHCTVHHTALTNASSMPKHLAGKKNVIISIHLPSRSGMIELTEDKQLPSSLTLAQELSKDAVVIIFGNPYNIPLFKNASDILVAYDDDEYAHKAAARSLWASFRPRAYCQSLLQKNFRKAQPPLLIGYPNFKPHPILRGRTVISYTHASPYFNNLPTPM